MKQSEIDNMDLMYNKLDRKCFVCGNQATERAHTLGQGKYDRKAFGNEIIDSPYNWLPTCHEHNIIVDISNSAWPLFANNHSKWIEYMNTLDYEQVDKNIILDYYNDLFRSMERIK